MSAQFEMPDADSVPAADACPVCGGPIDREPARCGSCGYHLGGIGERPGPLDRAALLWSIAGFALVYVIVMLVVLAAR
jgi:hypothetical protein